ncbi:MAG: serine/threonine-protein kinase [Pseudomonadota bacterium]
MAEDVFGIVGSVIASAYHVESVVAEGGFGVVYRAHHGGLRAPVALKLLKVPAQNPQQQAAFLQLFRAEAELLFRLSASLPNVVRALHVDAFTSKGGRFVPYLVLEWLEGITLETLIEQRKRANLAPVTLRKLVRLLTPVARALERAHNFSGPQGRVSIVHRDLKPENLFIAQVAGEEVVKILDFGIGKVKSVASQVAGRMSQDGSAPIAFTPAYGAPEQWAPRHFGQTGPWTDVWGLALCMVEVMAARTLIEGEPATMRGIALDPQRRPTPRNQGIDLPDAIEAVFERALALDPHARQPHAGVFWDELVAALDRPEAVAPAGTIALAEDLEFDPTSVRRLAAAPVRVSAPYSIPIAASMRRVAASRPPAPAPSAAPVAAPAPMRAAALSAPHFVPDLELAPPCVSRRPSAERPAAQPAAAEASVLDLDDAALPAALDLDLDLPADEPRAQRGVSSPSLAAVRPSNPPPSRSGSSARSGSMAAVREPQLGSLASGVIFTRNSSPELQVVAEREGEPSRSARNSRPPPSADVSAAFEAAFVAKIDPKLLEERSLAQRLRPAAALLGAAILVAIFDPIYAAATGEVLEIVGQRLSLLAGALLLLAVGLAAREVAREK